MSVVKLFIFEGKFMCVHSLEISVRSLLVMELCSAIRPNNEPLRESAQVLLDSVTSLAGKAGG